MKQLKIFGTKYYLQADGTMKTGWKKIKSKWYYFDDSGAMVTGWKKINGNWYYLKKDGTMAASEYIDGYYLDADGVWRKSIHATENKEGDTPYAGNKIHLSRRKEDHHQAVPRFLSPERTLHVPANLAGCGRLA